MLKEIKYTGFTATPSDYECPDGELDAAINLVPEDAELKPVKQGELIVTLLSGEDVDNNQTFSYKYRLLFVHRNTSYKHAILVKEKYYEGETDVYCQLFWVGLSNDGRLSDILADALNDDNLTPTSIPRSYTCAEGKSLSVSAIGNTLIVTGAKDGCMHYVLWKDNAYKYLGDHMPEIYLSFSLKGAVDYRAPQGGYSFDNSSLHLQDPSRAGSYYQQIISFAARKISDSIMGFVVEKAKAIIDGGQFIYPFFVRYALRLYDGSLTMHSAPILMNPCTTCNPFVYAQSATEEYVNIVAMFVKADLQCKFLNVISDDSSNLSNWEDIITGVDIFVSNQMCPFNQDGNITGLENMTTAGTAGTSTTGRTGSVGRRLGLGSTSVKDSVFIGSFDGSNYAQFKFTHIYGENPRARDGRTGTYDSDTNDGSDIVGGAWPKFAFALPELEEGQIKKNIETANNFYFLCSIPLNELSEYTTRKKVDFNVTKIDTSWGTLGRQQDAATSVLTSLVGQEVMTDDYHSHDKISPVSILDYNNRLNLAGIKRTLFNGFPLCSMLAYCNTRYNYAVVAGAAGGSRPQSSTHGEFQYIESYDKYTVVVSLKFNGEEKEVTCDLDRFSVSIQNILSDRNSNLEYQGESWGNYLFYPDANAYKMRIIHRGSGDPFGLYHNSGEYYDITLKPHDFLNGAYAFLDYNTVRLKTGELSSLPSSSQVKIDELGKIYTSDASNPFVFTTTNINTIGTGDILYIATAAKALSQGQFGQFPLYVFTTEGVWALEVSSTGSFNAKQIITRDVCINPASITQLDTAVLFATDRGIMLLSGSDSICITDSISSDVEFLTSSLPKLGNLTHACITTAADIVPFKQFLPTARMLYDYTHQRIIVYNPAKTYAYVYSLKSKQWGMMQSNIKDGIKAYPECLAVDGSNNIIDLSSVAESDTSAVNALLITRPLKLDAPDVLKTIDTIIQRGQFRKGNVQTILYGSRDLFNWQLVSSSVDHYLRGFRGTPYKYFRIVLLCSLKKDESIFGCSIGYTPRLTDKLR